GEDVRPVLGLRSLDEGRQVRGRRDPLRRAVERAAADRRKGDAGVRGAAGGACEPDRCLASGPAAFVRPVPEDDERTGDGDRRLAQGDLRSACERAPSPEWPSFWG